jgi:hypothetical protein
MLQPFVCLCYRLRISSIMKLFLPQCRHQQPFSCKVFGTVVLKGRNAWAETTGSGRGDTVATAFKTAGSFCQLRFDMPLF